MVKPFKNITCGYIHYLPEHSPISSSASLAAASLAAASLVAASLAAASLAAASLAAAAPAPTPYMSNNEWNYRSVNMFLYYTAGPHVTKCQKLQY